MSQESKSENYNDRPEEWVAIIGYGSLLSKKSAKMTMPSLRHFCPVLVPGYRRCFNLVSITQIKLGYSNSKTKEMAAVVAQPVDKRDDDAICSPMLASYFEIPKYELDGYYRREARYQFEVAKVLPWNDSCKLKGGSCKDEAIICIEYKKGNHDLYVKDMFKGDKKKYHEAVGQYYDGKLWRKDILPVEKYLQLCMKGAREIAGEAGVKNFLETSYLACGKVSLKKYLERHSIAGI
mmetsp:Transcript_22899/g.32046  ORF Transcript_22899/g.32046 Transcript_22899/m.32046 type:complete len:236 (-) Transcript_22899:307-1014(-)|eukprot:CAMPEP_0185259300 /NCGR_PEP_ID=MMETSP1359-20130426/8099_1 /TAXON_ID=552665 /ORGANISM="Bigelowiella longifila, Strain CCMP242" /LENGTH=235 /DNA_ID=CAMNT_0027845153 /DNA_START=111 /DNA_END=818 /DNA_ORIENTATION=-